MFLLQGAEKGSGTEGKRTYEVKKLEKEKSVVRTEGRGEGVRTGSVPGTQFSDLYSNRRGRKSPRGPGREDLNGQICSFSPEEIPKSSRLLQKN